MTKRGAAGYIALIITVFFTFYQTDAWVNQALDYTTLPVLVWAIVDWGKTTFPVFNDLIGGEAPFIAALALAILLPGGAYLTQVFWSNLFPFTKEGFGAALGIGFTVATGIYKATKGGNPGGKVS